MFSRIFGVSQKTFDFLFSNKKEFLQKLLIIIPIAFWGSVLYQIQPIFYKFGIDAITEKKLDFTFPWIKYSVHFDSPLYILVYISLILLVLTVVDKVLNYFKDNLIQKLNYDISARFEDNFTNFLSKFDGSFIGVENNMRLVDDIQRQMRQIEPKISSMISKIITIPSSIITILFILPLIHPYLIGIVILYSLVNFTFENISWLNWQKYEIVRSRLGGVASRIKGWILYYFPRVVGNGWVNKLWELYMEKRQKEFDVSYEQDQSDRKLNLTKQLFLNVLDFGSKVLAGFLVLTSAITIGTFVVFDQYIGRFRSIFDDIAGLAKDFVEIRFELFKIDFMLNLKSKLDFSNISSFADKKVETIEIKNLNFTYPKFYEEEKVYFEKMKAKLKIVTEDKSEKDANLISKALRLFQKNNVGEWQRRRYQKTLKDLDKILEKSGEEKQVLQNLNLNLEKGNIYALVGYNGAGKTTLNALIKRNLDPTSGEILINGKNLTTIEPMIWKSYISSMEQNSVIWPGITVRDNLLLGANQDIADSQMLEAIKKVGLEKEISGLDLICGENLELSGGQEQLLELARVILQQKSVVILDEGTNQLDAIKEDKIMTILNEIKKEAIVIFISHRMTSASKCDQIVVLDSGKIQNIGTHRELVKATESNIYQQMWNLQVGDNL